MSARIGRTPRSAVRAPRVTGPAASPRKESPANAETKPGSAGLAELREDAFVSLEGRTTKNLRFDGRGYPLRTETRSYSIDESEAGAGPKIPGEAKAAGQRETAGSTRSEDDFAVTQGRVTESSFDEHGNAVRTETTSFAVEESP